MTARATEGLELAKACARAADEIQAEDIRVWDVRGISSITDFIVVCCGNSMPHLRAVLRDVERHVGEWTGTRPVNAEGRAESHWVVLDYIDVMLHVMHAETRAHYGLEQLWGDAKEVAWRAGASSPQARVGKTAVVAKVSRAPRKAATKVAGGGKTAVKKTSAKTSAKRAAVKKSAPAKRARKKRGAE